MGYKEKTWYKSRPKKCHYCDNDSTSWDHIIPWNMQGRNAFFNMVPACESCQQSKANHFPTCECSKCVVAILRWSQGDRQTLKIQGRKH